MARPLTRAQMLAAFQKWKVPVKNYPNAVIRPGAFDAVYGIAIHHTGSDIQTDAYLGFLFRTGRPDEGIPGQLCQMSTDKDGDLHLGGVGRANHAGKGSSATLQQVINESYAAFKVELHPGADNTDGNAHLYGNEVRYDGSPAMVRAQYITVILSSAAICDAHDWTAASVIAHREWTSRKSDPGSMLMYKIRADVAAALKAGPGNWPAKASDVTPPVVSGGTPLSSAEVTELKNFTEARLDAYFTWMATNITQQLASIKGTQVDHTNRLIRIEDDTDDGTTKASAAQLAGFADLGPGPSGPPGEAAPAPTTAEDIIASDQHPAFVEVRSAKEAMEAALPPAEEGDTA